MIIPEEIQELRTMVRQFVDKEIIPYAGEYDRTGEMPTPLYDKCIEMGLNAAYMPEAFGGPELSKLAFAVLQEELARGDIGISTTMGATCLASLPVMLGGTKEQQALWWNIVAEKHYAAFCLTEPNAGSDAAAMRTTAHRDGDDYILNGTKCFISNGGLAGVYSVLATVDRSLGHKGLTAFIVERDRPGISIGKEEDKMGMRLSNTTEVLFDNVRIPASNRIGPEGGGFKVIMQTLDYSRPSVGAQGVGIAQRALEEAVKYAKQRVQFGKPIASFQGLQFMLADMAIEVETARQMAYHAADLIDHGATDFTYEACIAKTRGGDAAVKVALDAVQILGGYGYMREYPVEKLMRDAKIIQIYEGTNQIQRSVIAGKLLK
ncbi:MAG: acyl-CoA dehydrogenase [Flavonifractor sp.]|jgi:alkylation response protein AidB-like acyl-CoA dehydrogenase|nr:acyl-CoA dehydrogenase [Flavonifractor sp.]